MKTIKKYTFLIVCLCSSLSSFACLSAYQFKIFPVGVVGNEIVTVDFQIHRTHNIPADYWQEKWILKSYISTYNQQQQLLTAIPFDTVEIVKPNYVEDVQKIYNVAFAKIQTDFTSIELFTPTYISFCDFQSKCKLIEFADRNTAIYKNKKYSLGIFNDTLYYGFGGRFWYDEEDDVLFDEFANREFYVSSYRIYETGTVKLIVPHLAFGDMYFRRENKTKEYKPKIQFKNIKTAVYEEPLLHHGFGFDAFFVE